MAREGLFNADPCHHPSTFKSESETPLPIDHRSPLAHQGRFRVVTDRDPSISFTEQQFYSDPSPYVLAIGEGFSFVHRSTAFDLTQPEFTGPVNRTDLPPDEFIHGDEIRVTDFNGYSYELAIGPPDRYASEPIGRFVPLAYLCSVCGDIAPPKEARSAKSEDDRWPGRWCAWCHRTYKNRLKGKTVDGEMRDKSQVSPHQIHEREGSRTICEFKACNRNSCRYLWVVAEGSDFLIETGETTSPMGQAGYCDMHGDLLVEEGRARDIPPYPHCNFVSIEEKPRQIRYASGDSSLSKAKAIREFARSNTFKPRMDQIDSDGTVPENLAHALIQASIGATIRDKDGNPIWTTDEDWREYASRAGNVINVSPEQVQAWKDELLSMQEDGFSREEIVARAQEMHLEAWSDALNEATQGKYSLIDEEDDDE